MTKLFSFIRVAIVVLAAGTHSHAAPLVNVTGTWSFIMNGQGYTNQLFTGSTTFTYDKGLISGSGFEDINNIPVTSFSMTPNPVGLTFFDTSNVQARVIFDNGLVTQTRLFGILGGGNLGQNDDDFYFEDEFQSALLTVGSEPGIESGTNVSINFTHVIPEPGAIVLFATGVGSLVAFRRKRS